MQNGRALLFPVIALTGGSITGNGGFVKWAVGFSQGNTASPVPVRTDLNIRACLKSSNEDGDESKSKHLGRNKEFALTIFPKSAELVEPAK